MSISLSTMGMLWPIGGAQIYVHEYVYAIDVCVQDLQEVNLEMQEVPDGSSNYEACATTFSVASEVDVNVDVKVLKEV